MTQKLISLLVLVSLLVMATGGSGLAARPSSQTPWQSKVDPWVLETAAGGTTEFLVFLSDQADLSAAAALPTKLEKGRYVYEALTKKAAATQGPVIAALEALGVEHQPFWVANMIWVRGDAAALEALASRADVAHIYANPAVRLAAPVQPAEAETLMGPLAPATVEWNITKVNAPSVWAAGYTGQGAVVAGQDTGYQWDHPALKSKYRGWNGTTADHDYNWHDAIHATGSSCGADSAVPCDDDQHGTHTMGTMVGDDGAGNQIGMAPGAKWIGCRNMNAGVGTPTTYSECYQWFIAPTKINGSGADSSKAPDVINNSWGCPASEGCTSPNVLLTVVQSVRAAGIVTVHSAGNSGSSCSTVTDPAAIYAESFSVGATTSTDAIASYSSRGPVTVDGSNRLKPNVSAPGSSIRSSIPGSAYQGGWSGTSMAGPHVAGLVALLISAEPSIAGHVDYIEDVIEQSAVHLTSSQTCGGVSGTTIPNNTFGWGRINALAAYTLLRSPFTVTATPSLLDVTQPDNGTYAVAISRTLSSFPGPVALSVAGVPGGALSGFSPNPVAAPWNTTLTISNTSAAAAGTYTLTLTGSAGLASANTSVQLHLKSAPTAVTLSAFGRTAAVGGWPLAIAAAAALGGVALARGRRRRPR